MRVKVIGASDAAAALRGFLQKTGSVVVSGDGKDPIPVNVTFILEQSAGAEFYLDSVPCPLEQAVLKHIRDLASRPIELHTKGGNERDDTIRVVFPASEARAVELGCFRGYSDFAGPNPGSDNPRPPFVLSDPAPKDGGNAPSVQAVTASYERLLEERAAAHAHTLAEMKAGHAEALKIASGQIDSLQAQLKAEKEAPREDRATVERMLADKQAAHERTLEEIKGQHAAAVADRDERIKALESKLSSQADAHQKAIADLSTQHQAELSSRLAERDAAHDIAMRARDVLATEQVQVENFHRTAQVEDRDRQIEYLKAELDAERARPVNPDLTPHIETLKQSYERLIAEKDSLLLDLRSRLEAAPLAHSGDEATLRATFGDMLSQKEQAHARIVAEKDAQLSLKDSAHASEVQRLEAAHAAALSDKDRHIEFLEAQLAAALDTPVPPDVRPQLEALKDMYERMLAEKDAQIFDVRMRLNAATKPKAPWWKRALGRG